VYVNDVVVIGELPGEGAVDGAVTIEENDENPLPRRAARNDDGTVTLPLLYPVTLEWKKQGAATSTKDSYDSLTMRRLTGKDMMTMGAAARDKVASIGIALSAGIKPHIFQHVFERMDGADIKAASDVLNHFLGSGQPTGQ
jgi:hypothetical protein